MGTYFPGTSKEQKEMLESIGYSKIEELFSKIPPEVLLDRPLKIPEGLGELDVRRKMEGIAGKNKVFKTIFRGAGAYNHYIPSIVKQITSKEEFLTSYTPYQAEISQGILQSIFEYQTMICELTGMEAANASVYDGASAAAEAIAMCKERKRYKAIICEGTNPQVIATIKTYSVGNGIQLVFVPLKNGTTDLEALKAAMDEETACVYLQQPNFLGQIENGEAVGEIAHEKNTKFIMGCNPISLGILKSPGECMADIAVGEGQPLGLPLSFGGPYIGFMAATKKMMRKLPGRIVGETKDTKGRRGYVLTLQAREQHIRREKASSNICSNQALCALTNGVYMSTMGKEGLKETASQCMSKAHYLKEQMNKIKGFGLVYKGEFFHEFVTSSPIDPIHIMERLENEGILGGFPLEGENKGNILWCVTEMNSREEMDRLIQILKEVTFS